MTEPHPFTVDEIRARLFDEEDQYGIRPTNNWGAGDVPAPWALGDVVRLDQTREDLPRGFLERLRLSIVGTTLWTGEGAGRVYQYGYFFVCSAFSIGEDDSWYFRVAYSRSEPNASDRLHVIPGDPYVNYMSLFTLVETSDPAGLVRRRQWELDNGVTL